MPENEYVSAPTKTLSSNLEQTIPHRETITMQTILYLKHFHSSITILNILIHPIPRTY